MRSNSCFFPVDTGTRMAIMMIQYLLIRITCYLFVIHAVTIHSNLTNTRKRGTGFLVR